MDEEGHTGANNVGASALFCASRAGHVGVVQFLLTFGASVDLAKPNGATSLSIACQENHIEVVTLLLDGGASVDLANDDGFTPLFVACQGNHIEVVTLLLDAGASADLADVDGSTPLHIACQQNNIEVVTLLIDAGASVDLAMNGGSTPLHIACQENHIEVVTVLLDAGASADLAMNGGWTPLYVASLENSIGAVTLLIDAGASIDLADDDGYTPLYTASVKNRIEVMKQLLAAGASRDLAVQGFNPLKIAKHFKHTAAVELLEAWPLLSLHLLMVATVTRNSAAVRELLHSGEDPALTVQYQQHTLSALVLARNETTCSWAAPVCAETLRLIERSLQWSPYDLKAHYLFPPAFRRGVRHVLGLMVALERVGRELPQPIWMLIVASLPRDWGLTIN